jgi:hypothetical protein
MAVTAGVCVVLELLILVRLGACQMKPAVDNTRANRVRTGYQIAQIAGGLGSFSENCRRLPYPIRRAPFPEDNVIKPNGTGRALHSWRWEVLGMVASWMRPPWDGTQPWDSPARRASLALSDYYTYDEAKDWVADGKLFPETNILAITGPGTAFGEDRGEPPKRLDKLPRSTIIAAEVRASGIPWPAPGDFDIRTMPQTICAPDGKGISSRHPGGFFVVFADTRVWFLSDKIPFDTLKKLFTLEEAKKSDREKLLGPYVVERGPYWEEADRIFGRRLSDFARAWSERGLEEWEKEQKRGRIPGKPGAEKGPEKAPRKTGAK